jgi:hypothetical protein
MIWLIDESRPPQDLSNETLRQEARASLRSGPVRGGRRTHIAVRLHDVIIHDNKKWFGEADIRLDALVLHGNGNAGRPDSFYSPGTIRFNRVADGDRLPIGETGLLIFYGIPRYFLDMFINVSRDRKDSDDLATLLSDTFRSKNAQDFMDSLSHLLVPVPDAAAIAASLRGAASIGNSAYRILRQMTGDTIGLYRTSWLQHRDSFGVGRHPPTHSYKVKQLSFWYDIVLDTEAPTSQSPVK